MDVDDMSTRHELSSVSHSGDKVVLGCWLLSCIPQPPLTIQIKKRKTVSGLAAAIKDALPQPFAGIGFDQIEIFKLHPPIHSNDIDAQVRQASTVDEIPGCIQLGHLDILNLHFSSPPILHLHIIVQAPRVCYVYEHFPKRRRVEGSDMPQIPRLLTEPEVTTKSSPPRLSRIQTEGAMHEALEPFEKYITYLAEGKLDFYFDKIQPDKKVIQDLAAGLPSRPILLLHDLGRNVNDQRIKSLFVQDNTVHLFAASGSGKTRLSFEALCHFWGFYFSCQKGADSIGSDDFKTATTFGENMGTWDDGNDVDKVDSRKHVTMADRVFQMLICARVFVLKELLKKLPQGTDPMLARRRWVLVQALPPSFASEQDIFNVVIQQLRAADIAVIESIVSSMFNEIKMQVGKQFFPAPIPMFFAVVDEAQVAALYLEKSFRSSNGDDMRPVLHAFYRFLSSLMYVDGIVLSGTGLSMDMVWHSKSSQTAWPVVNHVIFTEVGQFTKDDPVHRNYINKYLEISNSNSDKRLVERILYWFTGRYRFTATLIEILLSTNRASWHRALTACVYALTQFTLTDAVDLEEKEPPSECQISNVAATVTTYGNFFTAGHLLNEPNREDLTKYLFQLLMRWRLASQPTTLPIERHLHETVALGVGYLQHMNLRQRLNPRKYLPVYLSEPLVVLHLSTTFENDLRTAPQTAIADSFRTVRDTMELGVVRLEEAVAMVLLHAFGSEPRRLSDVFHCNQPWRSRKVTLVTLKRTTDDEMQCFPISWTSGSSDRLGYKATSPKAVLEFFKNPDGKAFLYPDSHMGPDVMCFLRDDETGDLILCSVQVRDVTELETRTWMSALQSVKPEFFYSINSKQEGRVQYAALEYPGLATDLSELLESTLGPGGYTPIIQEHYNYSAVAQTPERRSTPRYLRLLASPDDKQGLGLKEDRPPDLGVLNWKWAAHYFGSRLMAVANELQSIR